MQKMKDMKPEFKTQNNTKQIAGVNINSQSKVGLTQYNLSN